MNKSQKIKCRAPITQLWKYNERPVSLQADQPDAKTNPQLNNNNKQLLYNSHLTLDCHSIYCTDVLLGS